MLGLLGYLVVRIRLRRTREEQTVVIDDRVAWALATLSINLSVCHVADY